jgi:histidinol-phosphate aminotransferase
MKDIDSLVRHNVRLLKPYSCARDEYSGKEGIFLDANENPYGPLNRYPDPYQLELKSVISRIKGVPENHIFLGNGSDEIIDLCFRIFCNPGREKALTFTPTYGMYQVAADSNDVELTRIPLDDDFQIKPADYLPYSKNSNLKVTLICSPNNPTGNKFRRTDIREIIRASSGIVLLDEAYIDFSAEPSFLTELAEYPNLIVMQTFSKAWGMASVRVGMAFASAAIISYFNKMKPPYNISSVNQETVLRRLTDELRFSQEVRRILIERKRLSTELVEIPIITKVYPSDANFILVKTVDAVKTYSFLASAGIITRNRNSLAENCIRITVGTENENNRLLEALKKITI